MKLALLCGSKGNIMADRLRSTKDSLEIGVFNRVDDMIYQSLQKTYFFDRILISASPLRGKDVDEIFYALKNYLDNDVPITTTVVLICNESDSNMDIVNTFKKYLDSPTDIIVFSDTFSVRTLDDVVSLSLEQLASEFKTSRATENVDVVQEVVEEPKPAPTVIESKPKKKSFFEKLFGSRDSSKKVKKQQTEANSQKGMEKKQGTDTAKDSLSEGTYNDDSEKNLSELNLGIQGEENNEQVSSLGSSMPKTRIPENKNLDIDDKQLSSKGIKLDKQEIINENSNIENNDIEKEDLLEDIKENNSNDFTDVENVNDSDTIDKIDEDYVEDYNKGNEAEFDIDSIFGESNSVGTDENLDEYNDIFSENENNIDTDEDINTDEEIVDKAENINEKEETDIFNDSNEHYDDTDDFDVDNIFSESNKQEVLDKEDDIEDIFNSDINSVESEDIINTEEGISITENTEHLESEIKNEEGYMENTDLNKNDIDDTSDKIKLSKDDKVTDDLNTKQDNLSESNSEDFDIDTLLKADDINLDEDEVKDDFPVFMDTPVIEDDITEVTNSSEVTADVMAGVVNENDYRKNTEKVRVVEKIVNKGGAGKSPVDDIISGKHNKIVIVTGDRGSGLTTTSLNICKMFSNKAKTLFVDFDVKNHGSLNYLDYYDLQRYDTALAGVKNSKTHDAFYSNVVTLDEGFDYLFSDFGIEVSDTDIENTQYTLSSISDDYNLIVLDVPFKYLHLMQDLIPLSRVIICMETSKRGIMNTLCYLESDTLDKRIKRTLFTRSGFYLTKVSKNVNINSIIEYADSIVSFDNINWLDLYMYKDIKLNKFALDMLLGG